MTRTPHERWIHATEGECVILDNRDSFVFNLAHRLWEAGVPSVVVRSDDISVEELESWKPRALVISPGPGHPRDAGISVEAIRHFSGRIPILGVCLGHQAIGVAFGGVVDANGKPRHGKTSVIVHDQSGVFRNIPSPMEVGRYHALSVSGELPSALRSTAEYEGMNMGIEHREHPTFGVQFHPESVLTPNGLALLRNFGELL